jgi:hypothetical protein
MRSSYRTNNFGLLFTQTVLLRMPKTIVDLGVLNGYSTVHLATGAKHLSESMGCDSHVYAYDLFIGYEYKHGVKECVVRETERYDLQDYVTVKEMDAFEAYKEFEDESVDLIHLDISNDGDKIKKFLEVWNSKVNPYYGIVLLEGGSEERDNITWMVEYNKPSIRQELFSNSIISSEYNIFIYNQFPSVTMLMKTRGIKDGCCN